MRSTAPVVMFVYNQLERTQRTMEHLMDNHLAAQTDVYVFSDGGRDEASWQAVREVRHYLHTIDAFRSINIVERPCNYYLERNVVEGIAQVLALHDRLIVMEDDVLTSPYFLTYMNDALDYYRDEPRVMHVAGFTNLDIPERGDTFFSRHMAASGAWGTWRDRWQHFVHYNSREEALAGLTRQDIDHLTYNGRFACLKMLDKDPIPWDICWSIAMLRCDGLALHPTHTMIRNIGLTSGTHFTGMTHLRCFGWYEFDRPYRTTRVKVGGIPIAVDNEIEELYGRALVDHGMRYNLVGKIARKLYRMLRRK